MSAVEGIGWPSGAGVPSLRRAERIGATRPWIRLLTFTALAAYGTERWAMLLRPAPGWRLGGLLAVAVALAGGIPLIARRDRVVASLAAFLVTLTAFPIAGLRWEWFTQVRAAVSAEAIGNGLAALPSVFVPYAGGRPDVRLVIVLGAAVLLLDAAAVLAFAGRSGSGLGDGRRAAAALPLIALAVVPSTLVRPQWPYMQGLLLFGLLAAFLWGERVRRQTAQSALVVVAAAGVLGAVAAPHLDRHKPWVNYRAWAAAAPRRVDTFEWNQTYGPLRWPHSGHEVLTVRARSPEYWKAEDLDLFNGYAWVQAYSPQPDLPSPRRSALAKWTQPLQVTIEGMRTRDVIAAGLAAPPAPIPGGAGPGVDAGTWVAGRTLGPGTTYTVMTYSPRPTAGELATAGRRYPASLLANDLSLTIPQPGLAPRFAPTVRFAPFTSHAAPTTFGPAPPGSAVSILRRSPYARAYALARRLAAQAATPYAYIRSVERYLAHGFTYDTNPPARAGYPLESFLFSTRKGYCQQFSGAMALLLRMGGIPARVAAGFTPGTYDSAGHRWVVTDTDAHAWVEAWFPAYGWVRFDPTPPSTAAHTAAGQPIVGSFGQSAPASVATSRRSAGSGTVGGSAARPRTPADGTSPWPIVAAVILAAAVAVLLGRRWRVRAGRHVSPETLVDELDRALARTRRPLAAGTTLAALEQRLHGAPGAAAYVRTLRMARYGGAARVPTAAERRALRRELARDLGLSGRLRALWALPPWLRDRRRTAPPA